MTFFNEITKGISSIMLFYITVVTIISIVGFLLMGFDKYRSIRDQYRISELIFMALGFFGGAIGILLGMVCFRHKINKKKFYMGVPLLYIFNQIFHLIIYYRTTNI